LEGNVFVQHDGAQFFTVSFGSGERTLVAIGGWTGSWEVWADVFGELSQHWRTVGIDHRGTGATIGSTAGITVEQMTADLLAVLDVLEIKKCILAAESSGGAVALLAVYQHPERFEGLVLSSGLYYRPEQDDPRPFLAALEADYDAAVTYFVTNCLPETKDAAIHEWGKKILMRASQQAAIDLYKSTLGLDLRPILGQIDMPTLILHGDADRILPAASSQWLASQMPNCRLEILSGAGHAPMMTFPGKVAGAIDSYFGSER
jgi:pimeloyl-ACP methyl ester carboxylesterase